MKLIDKIKKETAELDRENDKGFVGKKGSTLKMNETSTTVASNELVSYKLLNDSESSNETAFESKTITNRKTIKTDDIVVNKHKLNPQLYELTDFKQIREDAYSAIGNLTMMGTVLVKAYEPTLKKYVLIRRQVRMPVFSNMINIPDAPKDMSINTDITKEIEEIRNSRG